MCYESYGDWPSYRRHLNLQSVHLRGLEVDPLVGVAPGLNVDADEAEHSLRQNRLTKVSRGDTAGWWPLHYAALAGDSQVVSALLRLRADPNRRASKDEPKLGFPLWVWRPSIGTTTLQGF